MKTAKKAMLMTLCAIILVVATVFGTMAYLTSTDKVDNTFTVGNVKITLDEAKVDTDGSPVTGAARVKENSYKLMPGHTYTKDPTIHVDAASEDCFIRAKVTLKTSSRAPTMISGGSLSLPSMKRRIPSPIPSFTRTKATPMSWASASGQAPTAKTSFCSMRLQFPAV